MRKSSFDSCPAILPEPTDRLAFPHSPPGPKNRMPRPIILAALLLLLPSCDSRPADGKQIETVHNAKAVENPLITKVNMNRLDRVMGELLETWGQRYTFEHDRQEHKISFEVPGFKLTLVEQGEGDEVAILFEESGTKHKAVCSVEEAPRIIDALLFPPPEAQ